MRIRRGCRYAGFGIPYTELFASYVIVAFNPIPMVGGGRKVRKLEKTVEQGAHVLLNNKTTGQHCTKVQIPEGTTKFRYFFFFGRSH